MTLRYHEYRSIGRTRAAKRFKEAVAFFYAEAGWSYDPKTQTEEQGRQESAERLARAERKAEDAGLTYDWFIDPDGCIGGDCEPCASNRHHPGVYCCTAYRGEKIVASLGSICQPSRAYRRVIEAELALEALS